MNAAYLLLTSAWMAGADPVPAPIAAPAAAAPVVSTGSCCGGGVSTSASCGCDNACGPNLFEKLKGRFSRNDCGCSSSCAPACDPCRPKFQLPKFNFGCGCKAESSCAPTCAPAPVCAPVHVRAHSSCGSSHDSCNDSCKPGFLARMKSKFSRGCDSGCDGGCGTATSGCSGCGSSAPAHSAPVIQGTPVTPAAPADAPKAMPKTGGSASAGNLNSTLLGVEQENRKPF